MAQHVDKQTLADALRWSRPRLNRALDVWPDFPVVARGTQQGGWNFDLDAVHAYLTGKSASAGATSGAARRALPGNGSSLVAGFDCQALAAALGIPLSELERRLSYDGDFPALVRGRAWVAWSFDLEAVLRHVEQQAAIELARPVALCAAIVCHVSKGELSRILNWGPSQLNTRLVQDPSFPVLVRGKVRTAWSFDLATVRRHLGYQGNAGGTVGARELVRALRWQPEQLAAALGRDGFPLVARGEHADSWAAFDLAAVAAHSGIPRAVSLSVRGMGKKELARELSLSRPTLDALLRADPSFPVILRGTQRGGWAFDLAAVRAHLGMSAAGPSPESA